jgi:hypothetical protein
MTYPVTISIRHDCMHAESMRWNSTRHSCSHGGTRPLCLPRSVTQPEPFFPEPLHLVRIPCHPETTKKSSPIAASNKWVIDNHHYDKMRTVTCTIAYIIALLLDAIWSAKCYGERAIIAGVSLPQSGASGCSQDELGFRSAGIRWLKGSLMKFPAPRIHGKVEDRFRANDSTLPANSSGFSK